MRKNRNFALRITLFVLFLLLLVTVVLYFLWPTSYVNSQSLLSNEETSRPFKRQTTIIFRKSKSLTAQSKQLVSGYNWERLFDKKYFSKSNEDLRYEFKKRKTKFSDYNLFQFFQPIENAKGKTEEKKIIDGILKGNANFDLQRLIFAFLHFAIQQSRLPKSQQLDATQITAEDRNEYQTKGNNYLSDKLQNILGNQPDNLPVLRFIANNNRNCKTFLWWMKVTAKLKCFQLEIELKKAVVAAELVAFAYQVLKFIYFQVEDLLPKNLQNKRSITPELVRGIITLFQNKRNELNPSSKLSKAKQNAYQNLKVKEAEYQNKKRSFDAKKIDQEAFKKKNCWWGLWCSNKNELNKINRQLEERRKAKELAKEALDQAKTTYKEAVERLQDKQKGLDDVYRNKFVKPFFEIFFQKMRFQVEVNGKSQKTKSFFDIIEFLETTSIISIYGHFPILGKTRLNLKELLTKEQKKRVKDLLKKEIESRLFVKIPQRLNVFLQKAHDLMIGKNALLKQFKENNSFLGVNLNKFASDMIITKTINQPLQQKLTMFLLQNRSELIRFGIYLQDKNKLKAEFQWNYQQLQQKDFSVEQYFVRAVAEDKKLLILKLKTPNNKKIHTLVLQFSTPKKYKVVFYDDSGWEQNLNAFLQVA